MIALPFGLDPFEQLGVRSFKIVGKFHPCVQSVGVNLEPFSKFLCGGIVKERNVLVEVISASPLARGERTASRLYAKKNSTSPLLTKERRPIAILRRTRAFLN